MRETGELLDKLRQILILPFLPKKLVLRVTPLHHTFKKMPNMPLLLEHPPYNINMLPCKIFPGFGQLLMKIEQLGFELIKLAFTGYLDCCAIETEPFG